MEVYERINQLLLEKNISKRDFAKKLRSIEPKLKSTGEIPTEKAIYGYLNGKSGLKIELIPYIAEALNIKEQELFENTLEKNTYSKHESGTACVKESVLSYNEEDKQLKILIELLPYAPNTLIENLIEKLEKIKKISDLV
mgnify:CR=1 FL=1